MTILQKILITIPLLSVILSCGYLIFIHSKGCPFDKVTAQLSDAPLFLWVYVLSFSMGGLVGWVLAKAG
jgi:ABC-type microcin C transport system permease subunit YejB